jgi:hypothetical protein
VTLLLLKLALAPTLVAGAGLAGRRYGPRVGGWLIGFPVVAGPVLWFYAREQGNAFAAGAAAGTAMGIVSLCGFLVAYALGAQRFGWLASLLLGYAAFAGLTAALLQAQQLVHGTPSWPLGLLAAFTALSATIGLLRRLPARAQAPRPRRDLLLRVLATALLVLALTGLARVLGPALSGLVTPFPVATTILVVFAHREAGPGGVLAVYGGYLPSLYSFAAFCAALSFALGRWPLPGAFLFALLVSLLSQTLVLKSLGRTVRQPVPAPGDPRDWRGPHPPA